jgi:hypothetical protein
MYKNYKKHQSVPAGEKEDMPGVDKILWAGILILNYSIYYCNGFS